jgi:hypothetical protein
VTFTVTVAVTFTVTVAVEAATERPINSPMPQRQAFPQAAWSHAQGVAPVAGIGSTSRAWRSRPRTTLDRPHPQNTLFASLLFQNGTEGMPPARGLIFPSILSPRLFYDFIPRKLFP